MASYQKKTVNILLVEDNEADVILMTEAFGEKDCNIIVVHDGEEAVDLLKKRNGFEEAVRPDLIITDLHIPKIDGRMLVNALKSDDDLKMIPIIVMSGSNAERDIHDIYDLNANSYIVKPDSLEDLYKVANTIENYWFDLAKLPQKQRKPSISSEDYYD